MGRVGRPRRVLRGGGQKVRTEEDDALGEKVCLFCLSYCSEVDVLETEVGYDVNLQLVLNSPGKNKKSFEILSGLFNVDVTSRTEFRFDVSSPLPLCLKCQHLYQEVYQLYLQIQDLERLLHGRKELIKGIIARSERKDVKWVVEGSHLAKMGLDVFRSDVITSGQTGAPGKRGKRLGNPLRPTRNKRGASSSTSKGNPKITSDKEMCQTSSEHGAHTEVKQEVCVGDFDMTEDKIEFQSDFDDVVAHENNQHLENKNDMEDGNDPSYEPGLDDNEDFIQSNESDDNDNEIEDDISLSIKKPRKRGRPPGRKPKREQPPARTSSSKRPSRVGATYKKNTDTRFTCHLCEQKIKGFGPFKQHYQDEHPGEKRYTCKFCKMYFKGLWDVTTHQRMHTGEKPFECSLCNKRFTTVKAKNLHLKYQHEGVQKKHQCDKCDKRFACESQVKYHISEVHGDSVIFCKECGANYRTAAAFSKHNKVKHDNNAEGTEPLVNPSQEQLESLGVKLTARANKSPFACHVCWITVMSKTSLKNHFAEAHPGMTLKECKCGRKFSTYWDCRKHAVRHLTEKPLQCDQCPMRFFTRTELRNHSNAHNPNPPKSHICDICGLAFRFNSVLVSHQKKHDGHRWICEFCGKSYSEKRGYVLHKKSVHLNMRPHKCPHCPRSFVEHGEMLRHIRIHTKEKPFKCPMCEKCFPYTSSRRRHILEVHKKQTTRRTGRKRSAQASNNEISAGTEVYFGDLSRETGEAPSEVVKKEAFGDTPLLARNTCNIMQL